MFVYLDLFVLLLRDVVLVFVVCFDLVGYGLFEVDFRFNSSLKSVTI